MRGCWLIIVLVAYTKGETCTAPLKFTFYIIMDKTKIIIAEFLCCNLSLLYSTMRRHLRQNRDQQYVATCPTSEAERKKDAGEFLPELHRNPDTKGGKKGRDVSHLQF